MMRAQLHHAGLDVSLFHAAGSGHANQDRWLVQPFESQLRVAAIDGVTTWRPAPSPGGDPGQWAPATVLGCLALPMTLGDALAHANALVHDPAVTPSRRQAMAAVAVADCHAVDGLVEWQGLVSADCEVWTAPAADSAPRLIVGGEFMSPEHAALWETVKASHPADWPFDERLAAEAVLLDDPRTQVCHAVGRYPAPVFGSGAGRDAILVIASDGVCMAQATQQGITVADLGEWLTSVEARTSRDDLTCLVVSVS